METPAAVGAVAVEISVFIAPGLDRQRQVKRGRQRVEYLAIFVNLASTL